MIKRWTDKEIVYLKLNYKRQTNPEIAKYLDRSVRSVERMADKLKIRKYKVYKKRVMEKK